ncbi:MAG: hypothetical protein L6Q76_02845, partial [Polyangiaceae bacterium]|nr:hypothetical protein [Polyangiaceae bacterium]
MGAIISGVSGGFGLFASGRLSGRCHAAQPTSGEGGVESFTLADTVFAYSQKRRSLAAAMVL